MVIKKIFSYYSSSYSLNIKSEYDEPPIIYIRVFFFLYPCSFLQLSTLLSLEDRENLSVLYSRYECYEVLGNKVVVLSNQVPLISFILTNGIRTSRV